MEFNLADLFEATVDAVSEREALVAGGRRMTYAELEARANRLAHHLSASGIRTGEHIGIYAYNRAEWVEALFAAYKLRVVPININFRYVEEELRYLFDNADLVAIVHERRFAPRIAAVLNDLPQLRHFVVLEDESGAGDSGLGSIPYEDALAAASPKRDFAQRSGDDLYMLYTGGTTGMPKGVMWRHEDLYFGGLGGAVAQPPIERPQQVSERAKAGRGQTAIAIAPLMHGQAQWLVTSSLFSGNRVVVYTDRHFDPDGIWRLIERERVQMMTITGDAMGRPLADALAAAEAGYDLSSLTILHSGAAILSKTVKQELRDHLPNVMVLDGFGASETGYNGTVLDTQGPVAGPRFTMNRFTSVLDEDLRPLEPGSDVVGMLARRGHIPLGYYKDPAKTAETYREDANGVRWVIPGDYAQVEASGTILLLGRGSACINSGGEKIFPEEVEAAMKSHADVFDVLVVGVPDPRWGERVTAVVQPRAGRRPKLEDINALCRSKLAGYKLPRNLLLVDEVMRSPAGKPDYGWARSRAREAFGTTPRS